MEARIFCNIAVTSSSCDCCSYIVPRTSITEGYTEYTVSGVLCLVVAVCLRGVKKVSLGGTLFSCCPVSVDEDPFLAPFDETGNTSCLLWTVEARACGRALQLCPGMRQRRLYAACVPARHVTTMRRVSEEHVTIQCVGLDILRVLWADRFCGSDSS
jgi:hypothetical protein